jgi:hypothetical protein
MIMDRSANTHAELMGLLGEIKRLLGEIEEQARQPISTSAIIYYCLVHRYQDEGE